MMGFSAYSSAGVMLTNWEKPYSISLTVSVQRPSAVV